MRFDLEPGRVFEMLLDGTLLCGADHSHAIFLGEIGGQLDLQPNGANQVRLAIDLRVLD